LIRLGFILRMRSASSASGSASGFQPAIAGEVVCEFLQLVRGTFDTLIRRCHFFVGGSSPVSTPDTRRGATLTIVATEARVP
jgi:hypothetical protein